MSKIIVLGINGHIGHIVARAFLAAGWQVDGFGRSNKHPVRGVNFIQGDAEDVAAMRAAIGDTQVVFNALNLPYHQWTNGRKEAQTERVIAAASGGNKTLLFPGTIYNYAAKDRFVTPDTPQRPQTPRGEIRVRVENLYRAAAARRDLQVLVLRAGDFFGPDSRNDWFDLAMMTEAKKGKVGVMGVWGVGHSWAYLPDLARAFVRLAEARGRMQDFENFHFAGNYVTPEQMRDAIRDAAPAGTKVGLFPRFIIPVIGIVDPIMRDIAKMAYMWENPMELRDPRFDALLGPKFGTPFAEAIAATVAPFFPEMKVAA
jgi:nucleoside-diphosphate-sugar epimerase